MAYLHWSNLCFFIPARHVLHQTTLHAELRHLTTRDHLQPRHSLITYSHTTPVLALA